MTSSTHTIEKQEPLVPADVAFPGFQFVQFDIKAMTDGELSFLSGDGFKAALTLMAQSWRETPAASLPNDPRRLAALAGFGRGPAALADWEAVKDEALSDFVLCTDGRWYSRTLAPKAVEAWDGVKQRRSRTEAARQARAGNRLAGQVASADTFSVTEPATGGVASSATQSRGDKRRGEEKRGDERESNVIPLERGDQPYAFEAGIIKLNQKDYDAWKRSYPNINLDGELVAMAGWAERLKAEDKNWFQVLPVALNKKDREAKAASDHSRARAESEARIAIDRNSRASRPAI